MRVGGRSTQLSSPVPPGVGVGVGCFHTVPARGASSQPLTLLPSALVTKCEKQSPVTPISMLLQNSFPKLNSPTVRTTSHLSSPWFMIQLIPYRCLNSFSWLVINPVGGGPWLFTIKYSAKWAMRETGWLKFKLLIFLFPHSEVGLSTIPHLVYVPRSCCESHMRTVCVEALCEMLSPSHVLTALSVCK